MRGPRWQNWLGVLLGFYMLLTPWIIPAIFPVAPASAAIIIAGLIAGLTLASVSLVGIVDPEIWIDWLKYFLSFGLLLTPWLLGFNDNIFFTFNFVFAGMLLIVVSGLAFASRRPKIGRD